MLTVAVAADVGSAKINDDDAVNQNFATDAKYPACQSQISSSK